jgi:YD repeat-containing protein
MTYDEAGNLASKTSFSGQTIAYEYDGSDRLLSTTFPEGTQRINGFDDQGRIGQITDAQGVTRSSWTRSPDIRESFNPMERNCTTPTICGQPNLGHRPEWNSSV